jgi:hypothetical protein
MPPFEAFNGGFYEARSSTFSVDTAVNIYKETRQVEGSPKTTTLYGTPGLKLFASVFGGGCRGMFTQDGRTWAVIGSMLYELNTLLTTWVALGDVGTDGQPVSFSSNGISSNSVGTGSGGNQLGVVSAGGLYVLHLVTGVLTAVVLPFTGPVMLAFLDSYTLANEANSQVVWFSYQEDMTQWDGIDNFIRFGTSDTIVGIAVSRDRIWAFGSKTTTLFYDSGDTDTPFLPYPGSATQVGLVSPWALTLYADTFFWLATTEHGLRRIVMANDPLAQPISIPPIEQHIADCPSLADVYAMAYEQEGHVFIIFVLPSSPDPTNAFVYDATEKAWHTRAGWDSINGQYVRWRAKGSTTTNGLVLVGDYSSGDTYTLDLNTYTDNGAIIRRERTAPYLSAEAQWLFLEQVELGTQPGIGLVLGQGSDPMATLEISRDSAHTFVNAGNAPLGRIGAYTDRAVWRRLGRARADRLVIRVTQTDPVPCAWTGAWLRTTNGSGEL